MKDLKQLKKYLLPVTIGALTAAPFLAFAKRRPPENETEFRNLLEKIGNTMFTFLLAFSVLFIVTAGYFYVTAAGNPEQIKRAHRIVIWSLVAVIVGVLAKGLVLLVKNYFLVETV
jgi:peptidoglycan biosynthesis protein MviN/MurJ (putative lipid II flippase)